MLQSRSTANRDGPSGPANPGKNTAVPRTLTDERRSIDRRMRGRAGSRRHRADGLEARIRSEDVRVHRAGRTRDRVPSRRAGTGPGGPHRCARSSSIRRKPTLVAGGPRGAGPARREWIRSRRAIRTSVAPSPWQNLEIARALGTYRRRSSACLRGLGCVKVRADIRVGAHKMKRRRLVVRCD